MAFVLFAALNWATLAGPPPRRQLRPLVLALDAVMVAFGVVIVRAFPLPQAYLLLAAFIVTAVAGFFTPQPLASAQASASELPNERRS